MKTLKNLVLGVLFVCLIAACSKEETKPCECDTAKNTSPEVPQTVDCSVPKTKKITVQTRLYRWGQTEFAVSDYKGSVDHTPYPLMNHRIIVCNQDFVNKIIRGKTFRADSLVTIEACESETYYQANRSPINHFTFINILSIKPN
jgi:hypothetical protein